MTARLLCEVWVPGEPRPKARPRFDPYSGRAYTPKRTVAAEQAFGWQAKAARLVPEPEPSRPIAVDLCFYRNSGLGDLDNLVKLVLDACNGVLWADDRQVHQLRAALVCNAAFPGTRLFAYVCEEVSA